MKKIIYSLLVLGTLIPSLSQAKAMMVYRDQDTVNKAANVYKAADRTSSIRVRPSIRRLTVKPAKWR